MPRFLMKPPRLLVLCETSGTVRETFRRYGWDANSCDLLPADDESPNHIVGDMFEALEQEEWDLVIAHPPCTYLTGAGLHWNKRDPSREAKTEEAIKVVERLAKWASNGRRMAIENPVGCLSTRSSLGKPQQIIQPYEFGEDASKKTCFWLFNLPKLHIDPSKRFPGRLVEHNGKIVERWSNQTDSGQNRLPPSADRWKIRSKTYQGIADAMAEAWA